jgi:transposase-like protein
MTDLAAEARRLRREGLSGRQIQDRLGVPKQRLQDWLRGVPPPDRTGRPAAKDELRAQAVALRDDGWSVNDIAVELGVARSTAWRWVRHLPLDPDSERARRKREHAKVMTDARWERSRIDRAAQRSSIRQAAADSVGAIESDELIRLGAIMYWCEGTKVKPWRPGTERLVFTNSDPGLICLYLRFLAVLGVTADRIDYRLAIHETADVDASEAWWAEVVGEPRERFQRTTLKRHVAKTIGRHNVVNDYHGCLVVGVRRSRDLYWRVEGLVAGLTGRPGV